MSSPSRPKHKRKYDIPLQRSMGTGYLVWIIALMVYMATLVLSGDMVLNRVTGHWENTMTGRMTVEIPPVEGANEIAANARASAVIEVLEDAGGVINARRLPDDELLEMIDPWLGGIVAPDVLPMPVLIDVEIDPQNKPDLAALNAKIARQVPDARLDDHQAWLSDVLELINAMKIAALTLTFAIFMTAIGAVGGAIRSRMALHGDEVNLLHLMGASDGYIAGQFQRYAMISTLQGGMAGIILAWLTLYVLGRMAGELDSQMVPHMSLGLSDWAVLALIPLAGAAIAMLTARRTVISQLKQMP